MTRSFDIFCDLHLNKRLGKQSWGRWFETPSRLLWHHCDDTIHKPILCHDSVLHLNTIIRSKIWGMRHHLKLGNETMARHIVYFNHYDDVIMGATASQITSLTIVYWTVYSDADQRKHQSSASQAFVRGIHRGPKNSPHKWSVTRKMFPFDDFIMTFVWYLLPSL